MSTRTTSSALSNTVSGTVSATRTPVIPPTTSFRLSRCCTLTVVNTSMPASSSSRTSCQRFGWREPGALECASSSIKIRAGWRCNAASISNSEIVLPLYSTSFFGRIFRSPNCSAVSSRPCVSTMPIRTSQPSSRRRRAADSIAYVLPTPADAPKYMRSFPRTARLSSSWSCANSSSGSGREDDVAITSVGSGRVRYLVPAR